MNVQVLLDEVTNDLATTRVRQMDNADRLLKQVFNDVMALRKARELFADQLAPDFRLFDYLRTDEYGLSRCLADLLNPQGPHGQGRLFLDVFLERIGADDWAKSGTCRVITEKMTDQGRRIDIVLEFSNGIIAIENKPWAVDQNRQLSDYADWLQRVARNGHWRLIYLSNRDPDPVSLNEAERQVLEEKGHFLQISYGNAIDWLQSGLEKTRALAVRVFVEELIKFIRKSINSEIDMSEKDAVIASIMRSSESLESAILIAGSIDDVKRKLMAKFINDLGKKIEKINETQEPPYRLKIHRDLEGGEKESLFKVVFDQNQKKSLVFEFSEKNYMGFNWGIGKHDANVTRDPNDWDSIRSIMMDIYPGTHEQSDWCPWWAWAWQVGFGKGFTNWSAPSNHVPWAAILNDTLADTVIEIVNRVYGRFLANQNDTDLLMR